MPEDRDALVEELAKHPINGSFANGSLADYKASIIAAMERASILHPSTPAGDGELVEHLQERLLNEQMLAFKWMDAHDKLKAGKPYSFPAPADLPDALARVKELEEALTAAEAKTREEDARIAEDATRYTLTNSGGWIATAIRSRIPETDNGR